MMADNGYKVGKKVIRRSFVIPPEIDEALSQIQKHQGLANPSESFRYCVAHTFHHLSQPRASSAADDRLLTLVTKNNTLLRYLLIEIIKTHEGRDALSEGEQNYLKKLNQEVRNFYQKLEGKT
jgi:hypothetical protein